MTDERTDAIRDRYTNQLRKRLAAIMVVGATAAVEAVQAQIDNADNFFEMLSEMDKPQRDTMLAILDGQVATLDALEGRAHVHRAAIFPSPEAIAFAALNTDTKQVVGFDQRIAICVDCKNIYFTGEFHLPENQPQEPLS